MEFAADLHIHSRHSVATSKNADLESYYRWARIKGIPVLGTGDFTHPGWFEEIRNRLVREESGLFRLSEPPRDEALEGIVCRGMQPRFCLSGEISSIYKKDGFVRKVHSLIFAPDIDTASEIRSRLDAVGNISSDGRPILGLDPKILLEMILEVSERAYLIPAHVWTPWFSLFGSKSGFDTIEACFEELTGHIFALETGLSSDPAMNRHWSALDRYTLVSNSDAHSPAKLAREAVVFDTELSYDGLFDALRTRRGYRGTLEFYPQEGKYHLDGHRKCGICLEPHETARLQGRCPVCGGKLTVGVLHRVMQLADRDRPATPPQAQGFSYLIPLAELIAEIMGVGAGSKAVRNRYVKTVSAFGDELSVLRKAPLDEIERRADPLIAEAVRRMRAGRVHPRPGYDGAFGVIRVFEDGELDALKGQGELFALAAEHATAETASAASIPSKSCPHLTPSSAGMGGSAVPPSSVPCSPVPPATRHLDPQQRRAVDTQQRAVLVTAGPGSGKTRALTAWVVRLILERGVSPGRILAITFTNKAAREMTERLEVMLDLPAASHSSGPSAAPRVCTFHALCFDLLKERMQELTTVFDQSSRIGLLRLIDPSLSEARLRSRARELERLLQEGATDEPAASYRTMAERMGGVDVADLIPRAVALLDQDADFLSEVRRRFRYVAVDELQDINPAQYRLLRRLADGAEAVFAIGDPDQAIYGFRGSDVRLFRSFRDDYQPLEVTFPFNYRSTGRIVEGAGALITDRRAAVSSVRTDGDKLQIVTAPDSWEEARFIIRTVEEHLGGTTQIAVDSLAERGAGDYSFADFAVLTRTRSVRAELASALSEAGIPVTVREAGPLLTEPPLARLAPPLRLLANPHDMIAWSDLLCALLPEAPPEKIRTGVLGWTRDPGVFSSLQAALHWEQTLSGEQSGVLRDFLELRSDLELRLSERGLLSVIESLIERFITVDEPGSDEPAGAELSLRLDALRQAADQHGSDLGGFLRRVVLSPFESEGPYRTEKLSLLTFHASKGLEFPVVFIAAAEEGTTPISREGTSVEEERRLFYVAMTRAADRLYITSATRRRIYGRWKQRRPSRFISEIPPALVSPRTTAKRRTRPADTQQLLFRDLDRTGRAGK